MADAASRTAAAEAAERPGATDHPEAAEHPEAYVPSDRRRALAGGTPIPDRVHGAALFADISGFTPLTEALAVEFGARRGAEELSATLEVVFGAVLAQLHRFSGSAIYFSGDALTCWLDDDDGVPALACAFAMQQAMVEAGLVRLPSGVEVRLGMKVTIASGSARRFVVGDPDIQLIDALAGALVDELADAESAAGQGEVVVTATTAARIGDRASFGERRTTAAGATVQVARTLDVDVTPAPERDEVGGLPLEVTRRWLLPAVYERLRDGRGEMLAELRSVAPLFLRFTGIDYDADEDAPQRLDLFVVAAQRIVDGYGGSVLQLTIGDKGAYLYAVFGAPIAHEDDAVRACAAALDLLALSTGTAARDISIGLASGATRAGTYGHRRRRTFCCLGDPVNLAARLMTKAAPGQALVSHEVRAAAGEGFEWTDLGPMAVKGKAEPVRAHALLAPTTRRGSRRRPPQQAMIGRDGVLADLRQALAESRGGRGRVVGITGDPGVGKSRLLAEALAQPEAAEVLAALGETQAFGVRTPYYAWRDVLLTLLGVPAEAQPEHQLRLFGAVLAALDPQLGGRAPLLGMITGVELPDNDITAGMDAKLRKGSLELLVVQTVAQLSRRRGHLVLALEDCHLLDPLSQDLLDVVLRRVVDLPVLVVLTYRPMPPPEAPGWLTSLRAAGYGREIELADLAAADAGQLLDAVITAQLAVNAGEVPARSRAVLLERAQGNPFHLEQLVAFLRTADVNLTDPRALAAVDVPDTLQSLVLSRVDELSEAPRRTVKVASVVGRSFDVRTVDAAYPELGGSVEIMPAVGELARRDLVLPDELAVDAYLFRHTVVREVAYGSIPFALRAAMHEHVGAYLESRRVDGIGGSLDLIAHHYWLSDNLDRKQHFLLLAGDAAREAYANETAIEHYERLLALLPEDRAHTVLRSLGAVHELVGDWPAAASCYERAGSLAEASGDRGAVAWIVTARAELARKEGDFGRAAHLLDTALAEFGQLGDDAGVGRVLHLQGTLAGQQQQIERARERYERSLVIRRRLGDQQAESGLLANLGIMAEYEGDYAGAIELTEQALELRARLGDRWAIGHAYSNLGQLLLYTGEIDRAIEAQTQALHLHREVGDIWMIAIDLNNLAAAELRNDDLAGAARDFASCVDAHRIVDEPWSAAHLLEDIASLALRSERPDVALQLVGAADALRAAIGSPRTVPQQADQDAAFAPARAALGERAGRLLDEGRKLAIGGALDVAVALCRELMGVGS